MRPIHRLSRFGLAAITVAVALAGCTGGDGSGPMGTDTPLQEGKGAIAGLLVDDRFRPLELTDAPQTEFQAAGFVLLQETGQQTQTNENGEFTFGDLEPGTYTVRAQIAGHEATPQRVQVLEDVFNEVSVVARRITTDTNTILTEEYSIFVPCAFVLPGVGLFTLNCVLDVSGDSFRSSFWVNYTQYSDQVTYMVVEVLVNQPGNYALSVRDASVTDPAGTTRNFARHDWEGGDYGKAIIRNGDEPYQEGMDPWDASIETNVGLFYRGDVPLPENPATGPYAGATTGIQGDFLVSIFLGEPDEDIGSYCGLCGS